MNPSPHRPLAIGPLRAFEAVARLLSFRAAAEELHLTQSAISRQISGLEQELGCTLLLRGTRHVELSVDGATLLNAVLPFMQRLDASVRQLRQGRGRRVVNVTTFASFASLWLIPRLEAFQLAHPTIDIRISAGDQLLDLSEGEMDVALRYCQASRLTGPAVRLFGETLTPVASPWLVQQAQQGLTPPLRSPADLVNFTLAEEDDTRPSAQFLGWRRWLTQQGQPDLQPRRWLYLNFTYQQIQAAMSGQGLALARLALVAESLQRGELVEPFGLAGRASSPSAYWLLRSPGLPRKPEVELFCAWLLDQARQTRLVLGEEAQDSEDGLGE